ncbi:unnamed protein product [Brassicogethes aeneus]|uniref:Apolipoprotein D n=1 Tax=Brassicogethes aeneus TaxID=1431903 RepID=A0A9P0AVA2_BRAAE|nr:unnamed protein product [Brassicogethes aeneus]
MLNAMMNGVVVFLMVVVVAKAQIPFPGSCPDVQTMPDFDLNQFLGKWFESERYFAGPEVLGKCVTAEYSLGDNGTVTILNSQLNTITGTNTSIAGFGTPSKDDPAKLSIIFPSLPLKIQAPYWILDTDYTNYAVVWSCNDFLLFNTRSVWILTRSDNPTFPALESAYYALEKNGISTKYLMITDQIDCPSN